MTQHYKKALGPDLPSEKQLGKAISPTPCHRCVPIYPLRYGVAERSWDKGLFPTLSTDGYPQLAAGNAYGLRVLRPGAYVYLCYFQHGRMWTQHYQVTDDLRFARIWWTHDDDQDDIPGRLALFPQHEPLVFTRGTWLKDPINDELIAPVQEPK